MLNATCKDCVERHPGCHGHCEKYLAYRDAVERDKQAQKDARKDEDIYYGYVKRQVKRWEKSRNDH